MADANQPNGEPVKRDQSPMEKHLQTILNALAVALIVWLGSSVTTSGQVTARLEERLESMAREMQLMRSHLENQYTRREMDRDLEVIHETLRNHERRLMHLEGTRSQ